MREPRGQTMVEMALVFPLFVMLLFGIITLGIGVFYQQQLTNAAREAARYASVHSATAVNPTVSALDPAAPPLTYTRYDSPEDGWPHMTAAGRGLAFGLDPNSINISACWSGYQLIDPATGSPDPSAYDFPPPVEAPGYDLTPGASPPVYWDPDTAWAQCTIDGADPTIDPSAIDCAPGLPTDDKASSISEGQGRIVANAVTAYACYDWQPPLAGFLLIPENVTLRAVITEAIERQQ